MQRAMPALAAVSAALAANVAGGSKLPVYAPADRYYYDPGQRPMPRNHEKRSSPYTGPYRASSARMDNWNLWKAQRKRQRKAARRLELAQRGGFG